jgi:hypothetical protein
MYGLKPVPFNELSFAIRFASGAKARALFMELMYELKPVPFNELSFAIRRNPLPVLLP